MGSCLPLKEQLCGWTPCAEPFRGWGWSAPHLQPNGLLNVQGLGGLEIHQQAVLREGPDHAHVVGQTEVVANVLQAADPPRHRQRSEVLEEERFGFLPAQTRESEAAAFVGAPPLSSHACHLLCGPKEDRLRGGGEAAGEGGWSSQEEVAGEQLLAMGLSGASAQLSFMEPHS